MEAVIFMVFFRKELFKYLREPLVDQRLKCAIYGPNSQYKYSWLFEILFGNSCYKNRSIFGLDKQSGNKRQNRIIFEGYHFFQNRVTLPFYPWNGAEQRLLNFLPNFSRITKFFERLRNDLSRYWINLQCLIASDNIHVKGRLLLLLLRKE